MLLEKIWRWLIAPPAGNPHRYPPVPHPDNSCGIGWTGRWEANKPNPPIVADGNLTGLGWAGSKRGANR